MTKLISILIIVAALFVGWKLFQFWEKTKNEEEASKKELVVTGDQLPGLPYQLQESFNKAQQGGAAGLRDWLKTYGQGVQDPRKAWIQLDYCVLVSREDLGEARRIFAEVKQRTPESSPVWPRIKQLERSYQ